MNENGRPIERNLYLYFSYYISETKAINRKMEILAYN